MRVMWKVLIVVLLAVVALFVGCDNGDGGQGGTDASPEVIEGGLPANFPDDFPLYPDLDIVRSSPLAGRYVVEASSQDPPEEVVGFYEEELTKGRWELVATDDSSDAKSTTFIFTAPGFALDGRVLVAESTEDSAPTIVAIAMPLEEVGEHD